MNSKAWGEIGIIGLVYVAGTMAGSLGMHWFALHKIERKRA